MTPLRRRMIDAMLQRGFAQRTQESYVEAIVRMSKHYGRDPATYTVAEVEAYLLYLIKERKLSYSTVNQAACASRFLFLTVLGHERARFPIRAPRRRRRSRICWHAPRLPRCLRRVFIRCTVPCCKPSTRLACGFRKRAHCASPTSTVSPIA